MSHDVIVTGRWGLYEIRFETAAARAWQKKHASKGERTKLAPNVLACEGGDRCRDIVAALDRDGLTIIVNGLDMTGFGKR